MERLAAVFLSLCILGTHGCTLLGKSITVSTADLDGRIENGVYTSPTGTFRVRLPRLSNDGAEINDDMPSQGTLRLTIKDNLCREFIVSQHPGFLGRQSLAEWVDKHIVEPLNLEGFKIEMPKPVQTRYGTAILLRYRAAAGAPCDATRVEHGKHVETKLDADVAWYVFHHDDNIYRLIYVLGLLTEKPGNWISQFLIKREPVEEVLTEFAEGFELIAGKVN